MTSNAADDARALAALRLAGWAGLAFSLLSLIVIPLALPPPPPLGATAAEVSTYFDVHRSGFLVGNYLGIASFFPGFVQLAVFAARVRRLEGPGGWLASLVLTTGTFAYAVFACSLVVFQVLPFLAAPRSDLAIGAVGTLASVWFALDGLAALPLVLAVGWATVRTQALPRWFGRLSGAVACVTLVMSFGGLTATPSWLAAGGAATALGFVSFFAWTAAWAVAMLRVDRTVRSEKFRV